MTDLIVVSLEAWDSVWRRNQHIVSRLLARDPSLRVMFVEPPADPIHRVSQGRWPQLGHGPSPASRDRLWTMRPIKVLPRRIDAQADLRLARQIEEAAQGLGMAAPLLWINDPTAAIPLRRNRWRTLYDITDDWLAANRSESELKRLRLAEGCLLSHADEVVACSPELVRRKGSQRSTRQNPISLVRNAVDLAPYRSPRPRPADLPEGPIALYVGTLHKDRLDVDLCIDVARRLEASATVVLVGPNALALTATERLKEARARVLGARDHDEVIAYLQHANVLVVPHIVDQFTDSLDPIKRYEYSAAGHPVVATRVAGFRDADDDRIRLADRADFADALLATIESPEPCVSASRRPPADWGDRADAMHRILTRLESGGVA